MGEEYEENSQNSCIGEYKTTKVEINRIQEDRCNKQHMNGLYRSDAKMHLRLNLWYKPKRRTSQKV